MNGGRFGLVGVLYAGYKDDVDIEWNTNDFRTLRGQAAKITEPAVFQATVAIADLKADSL